MKKLILTVIVAIVGIVFLVNNYNAYNQPKTHKKKPQNEWMLKYAGAYTIELDKYSGQDMEVEILKKDGSATWMWIVPDSRNGAKAESEKHGTWAARKDEITVRIKGKTGTIITTYH